MFALHTGQHQSHDPKRLPLLEDPSTPERPAVKRTEAGDDLPLTANEHHRLQEWVRLFSSEGFVNAGQYHIFRFTGSSEQALNISPSRESPIPQRIVSRENLLSLIVST